MSVRMLSGIGLLFFCASCGEGHGEAKSPEANTPPVVAKSSESEKSSKGSSPSEAAPPKALIPPKETESSKSSAPLKAAGPFQDGSETVDALFETIVDALNRKDHAALQSVLVNWEEYSRVLWPKFEASKREPGNERLTELHWLMLSSESRKACGAVLNEWGGKQLSVVSWSSEETKDYGTYELINKPLLRVKTLDGREEVIRFLGSVVRHPCGLKMLSFQD
ncbi:MAG: hypothetical protein AAF517_08945 [Planctomycetota bacterium]